MTMHDRVNTKTSSNQKKLASSATSSIHTHTMSMFEFSKKH